MAAFQPDDPGLRISKNPLDRGPWTKPGESAKHPKEFSFSPWDNYATFSQLRKPHFPLTPKAFLVNDQKLKEKYWMESWESFYKPDRSNYLLIKFVPESMEVLNTKEGITGDTITWKVPVVKLD